MRNVPDRYPLHFLQQQQHLQQIPNAPQSPIDATRLRSFQIHPIVPPPTLAGSSPLLNQQGGVPGLALQYPPNFLTYAPKVGPTAQELMILKEQQERARDYPWNNRDWRKKNNPITCAAIAKFFGKKLKESDEKEKKKKKQSKKTDQSDSSEKEEEISESDEEPNLKKIKGLKTPLFHYQQESVKWMFQREKDIYNNIRGGMLCDEMGLGKTLSLLALVALDITKRKKTQSKTHSLSYFDYLFQNPFDCLGI